MTLPRQATSLHARLGSAIARDDIDTRQTVAEQPGAMLICADSLAAAQALMVVLGLPAARALSTATLLTAATSVAPADVAVLIGSDLPRILAAAAALRRQRNGVQVLAVGVPGDPETLRACSANGIAAVVDHDVRLDDLRVALARLPNGGIDLAAPPPLTAQIGLSGREADVLHLVADGWTNKEIAHRLRLELQTVKNHVGRILRKLGVRSRFDVARAWATRRRSRP